MGCFHGGAPKATLPLPRETMSALAADGCTRATLGFRPEAVQVVGEGQGFPFDTVVVEELGSDAYAYGTMHTERGEAGDKLVTIRVPARDVPMKGDRIYIGVPPGAAHVFNADTGRRVSGDVRVPTP